MVGTRKLARLLDHADAAGSKVVLVGDPCQLPEIDAGGAFRGLQARLGASHLTENRRQTEEWERDALAELRTGEPDRGVDAYLANERIHEAATGPDARALLVEDWMNSWVEDEDVLMVAARLAEVDDLNRRARTALRDEGYLAADRVVLAGRGFTEGDWVLALRNDYRVGVLNGTRGVVEQIDTTRHQMILGTDTGDQVTVPFAYAAEGHLTHGYATTIHKAQGATVDRCLVLLDDSTSREHAYTALSRGRRGNDLFVATEDRRIDERHATEIKHDPLADLRAAIRRRAAKRMAVDQVEPPPVRLDQLQRERGELRLRLGDGPPDPSWEHRRLSEALTREQHQRDGAQWRLDTARRDLEKLGPIGRRMHRAQRRELERRIEAPGRCRRAR